MSKGKWDSGGSKPPSRRKPRQPRGAPRRAAPVSRKAAEAAIRMKVRLVQLESRMTITERFLGIHVDQPPLQSRLDADNEEE